MVEIKMIWISKL